MDDTGKGRLKHQARPYQMVFINATDFVSS